MLDCSGGEGFAMWALASGGEGFAMWALASGGEGFAMWALAVITERGHGAAAAFGRAWHV
jgi:hypothetical protein